MQQIKKFPYLAFIVAILFVTGFTFSSAFFSRLNLGTPTVLGEENRDEEQNESEDGEDDKDEEDESEEQGSEDKSKEDEQDNGREKKSKSLKSGQKVEDEDEEDEADESDEEDEDGIEGQGDVDELNKKIKRTESRIKVLEANGVSVTSFWATLAEAKDLSNQAEAKLVSAPKEAEKILEVAEHKLERLGKLIKMTLGDEDEEEGDDDDAKEYKNEVAQFVHNLKEIGDMDGGIGQQVRVVAEAQNDSASDIENSINEINERNRFVKFLIGPKYENIAEVQKAIVENKTRIEILIGLADQVTDTAIKQVLQDQIKRFQQENNRLQSFVNESADGVSLFGWLVKMFS